VIYYQRHYLNKLIRYVARTFSIVAFSYCQLSKQILKSAFDEIHIKTRNEKFKIDDNVFSLHYGNRATVINDLDYLVYNNIKKRSKIKMRRYYSVFKTINT